MSENYEKFAARMEERFPLMFKDQRYGGFSVGEGWWPMLETLCSTIQHHITQNNDRRTRLLENNEHNQTIPEEIAQVEIGQIKEKFGGLRFYYQGGDQFIQGAAWMAESMSYQLCETCGNPGSRGGSGWISTLCDIHRAAHEQGKTE
jgi:hypothetical protein